MSTPEVSEVNPRRSVAALLDRPSAEVLVIGGGINGLAILRYLALQGVDVALVDRGDFGSGASAASSHMIHGGIRYLENGEFRLVMESVRERNELLRAAAHYVKPLRTTIPIFSTFSGIVAAPMRFLTHRAGAPRERGALLIKAGLALYDSFSRGRPRLPAHAFHGRRRSLSALPELAPNVKYTATYFDAAVNDPERLAIDVLHDALDGQQARSANYVSAVGADHRGVRLRDELSGREFIVESRVVINASGPWTDLTNSALGTETSFMGGTKGSHIVIDSPRLLAACAGREIFFENEDGRIVLIYPIKGRVLVGTTDLETDPRERPICTDEEVDYFFSLVRRVFPSIDLDREQIVFRYSGIRPLPRHDDLQPGFVSRDYRVEESVLSSATGTALISVVGGKWTTFRALADNVGGRALAILGRKQTVSTLGLAIGGGRDFPVDDSSRQIWVSRHSGSTSEARARQLLERYGTRAAEIMAHIDAGTDVPLENAPEYSRREIEYLVLTEHVARLSDVVLRRTSLAFTGILTRALLGELAEIVAVTLRWTTERTREEIDSCVAFLGRYHHLDLAIRSPEHEPTDRSRS